MKNQGDSDHFGEDNWPVEAWPDAGELLESARLIPDTREEDRKMFSYIPVIRELKNKGWSYRDIAAWFREQGAPLSDSKVYRLYQPYSDLDDITFRHVYETDGGGPYDSATVQAIERLGGTVDPEEIELIRRINDEKE